MSQTDAFGRPLRVYKDIIPQQSADDRAFVDILNKVSPYTMTISEGLERTYALFQAVKYLSQNKLAGAVVECGVWRGGSMMLVAYALQHFGDIGRHLYLYDTFTGMTEPDEIDVDFDNVAYKPRWLQISSQGMKMGFGDTIDAVRANMAVTGYPREQIHFIAGDVLQTIPANLPTPIALLRLDTDWYKSTLHELRYLYDLIVPHGVLIIDDYGWCQGARQATDEFFRDRSFKPMMHRVDQTARVIIKTM